MSQAGIVNMAGGGGGGSPVQTLTGNSGGPVPPTGNNINIIGTGGLSVAGNPGTSTLTISLAGGSPIDVINGDSGSISGSTVTIFANNATLNSGSSVKFVNSGTVSTFNVTDGLGNTLIGSNSGNLTLTGQSNTSTGTVSLHALTSGLRNSGFGAGSLQLLQGGSDNTACGESALNSVVNGANNVAVGSFALALCLSGNNTAVGQAALSNLTSNGGCVAVGAQALVSATGSNNCCVGFASCQFMTTGASNTCLGTNTGANLVTGNFNILIGQGAGAALTLAESSNICISSIGNTGNNNTIFIGTQGTGNGQQNLCFVAGITGATQVNTNTPKVVLCDSSGKLTSNGALAVGYVNNTAATYNVLSTDQIIGVNRAGAVTVNLPSTNLSTGQKWTVKDESGAAAANNITVVPGTGTIDGAANFVMNVNYGSIDIYFNGTNFFIN